MSLRPLTTEQVEKYLQLSYLHTLRTAGVPQDTLDLSTQQTLHQVASWLTLPSDTRTTGLLLIGRVGAGKTTTIQAVSTMLAALDAKATRELDPQIPREKLVTTTARQLYHLNLKDPLETDQLIDTRFLAVDDLGVEDVAAKRYGATITPVLDMIYHRYELRKPTILATNIPLTGTKDQYGQPVLGLREIYGERAYDRLAEAYQIITLNNPSRRRS